MSLIQVLQKELAEEARLTRQMLNRVPTDKLGWQPHPKSMTMERLAVHIAELPGWVAMALTTDGLDFAQMDYTPTVVSSTADVLALFDRALTDGEAALSRATDADLEPTFTLREGDTIFSIETKGETIRMALSQTIHHRAQLGVYLRLLNVPVPATYGPSADEPWQPVG